MPASQLAHSQDCARKCRLRRLVPVLLPRAAARCFWAVALPVVRPWLKIAVASRPWFMTMASSKRATKS